MKCFLKVILLSILILNCGGSDDSTPTIETPSDDVQPETESTFLKGMDLSFQSELETYNVDYKDANGNNIELLDFVAENGTNLVRLKLWHTPENGQNSLMDVKAYAQRIKSKNMDFLLDFHYSDTWADPGNQTPPALWENMTNDELKVAIYTYTKDVVQQLKNQNTLPTIIQIGNETDSGFLWNYGRVWGDFSGNWSNYADIVNEAIRAIREVDTADTIKIMLHHSKVEDAIYFFDELSNYAVDYDIIGLSYYPQFQTKSLNVVQSKLNELASNFQKDIFLVEVAYPFTFGFDDNSINFIGDSSQIISQYPATPEGQKAYMERLVNILKAIPNNRGIGFCYWAPDWVAFAGNETTSTEGSAWENQCVFDFNHTALPVFDVFRNN